MEARDNVCKLPGTANCQRYHESGTSPQVDDLQRLAFSAKRRCLARRILLNFRPISHRDKRYTEHTFCLRGAAKELARNNFPI